MDDDLPLESTDDSAASPTRPASEGSAAAATAAEDPSLHSLRKAVPISLLVNEAASNRNKTQQEATPEATTPTTTIIATTVQAIITSPEPLDTDSHLSSFLKRDRTSKNSTDSAASSSAAAGLVSPPSDNYSYSILLNNHNTTEDTATKAQTGYAILVASPPLDQRDTPSTDMSLTTSTTAASTTMTAGILDRRPSTPTSLSMSLSPDQPSILVWPGLEKHHHKASSSHRRHSSSTTSRHTTSSTSRHHRKRRAAPDVDLDSKQRELKRRSIREASDDNRRGNSRGPDANCTQGETGRAGRGTVGAAAAAAAAKNDAASSEADPDPRLEGDETNFVFRNRKRVYLPEGPDIYGI